MNRKILFGGLALLVAGGALARVFFKPTISIEKTEFTSKLLYRKVNLDSNFHEEQTPRIIPPVYSQVYRLEQDYPIVVIKPKLILDDNGQPIPTPYNRDPILVFE